MLCSDDPSLLNLNQLINDLINIMDKLMIEDFNYFPAVINAIQASILHIFTMNSSTSQSAIEILKQGSNRNLAELRDSLITSSILYTKDLLFFFIDFL